MNDDEVQRLVSERNQYRLALESVFECLDRVSADPKSVIRWTGSELVILGAARSLVIPVPTAVPTAVPTV